MKGLTTSTAVANMKKITTDFNLLSEDEKNALFWVENLQIIEQYSTKNIKNIDISKKFVDIYSPEYIDKFNKMTAKVGSITCNEMFWSMIADLSQVYGDSDEITKEYAVFILKNAFGRKLENVLEYIKLNFTRRSMYTLNVKDVNIVYHIIFKGRAFYDMAMANPTSINYLVEKKLYHKFK
jgi:hypothetical protein